MNDPSLFTYRLTIAYDGGDFSGWQRQPNGLSIQEMIEQALETIFKEKLSIVGSGRTDAGVHAEGQVAHLRTVKKMPPLALLRSLNGILPPSIRILDIAEAPSSFHAQRSATGKEYHYHISLGEAVLPFVRLYSWHIRSPLDLSLLKEASSHFVGKRDFKAFSNSSSEGASAKCSIRTISRLDLIVVPHGCLLEFEGDGFLYKMVRNIVGMIVAVALKKCPLDEIEKVFASKDRRLAQRAAPPQGLFLKRVFYQ